jgi:hypothetical protein
MGFDPCTFSLKIRESIETPTPKVGAHLSVWRFIPSHSPTLLGAWNVTLGFHLWPTPSQTFPLVASPRLGLLQKPLKNNDDWRTKEPKDHKNNKQTRKFARTTAPGYLKLLEDGFTQYGVENICNVNVKHHPIKWA